MYIESLQVPHPLKVGVETARPLIDALDIKAVRDELAATECLKPDSYDEAASQAVDHLLGTVRRALWFPETGSQPDDYDKYGLPYPLPMESMADGQFATCAGYAITGSEALDLAGIAHWVGFVNGHATLIQPFARSSRMRLADPLVPELSQDLQASTIRGSHEKTTADLRRYGRAALLLNTRRLARNSSLDFREAFERIPWLKYSSEQAVAFEDEREFYDEPGYADERDRRSRKLFRKYQVILNVFEAGPGRDMLEDYIEFKAELANGDYPSAATCLKSLSGNYPDIDARESHSDVKKLVGVLATEGQADMAKELIEGYFSSFDLSQDSRITESEADCLRLVAKKAGDASAASKARELYECAMQSPHAFRQRLAGKIGKTAALCADLSH
jgi:hypothetical protein